MFMFHIPYTYTPPLGLQWPWKDTGGTQEGTAQCPNPVGNARLVFVLKQRKLRLCFVLFYNRNLCLGGGERYFVLRLQISSHYL
jgi:hypothetical protein